MSPERYQQIRELFDAVAGLDPAARDARLRDADPEIRLEVKRLLKASDRGAWLDAPGVVETRPAATERWEGRRLGPYELLSEIGQGGMGIVYLARRADGAFQKQVAVKIIRQDLATPSFLARFQREREILARLEHPNIARLLDGGTTPNGLAYLVMEYIPGEPLLEYADSCSLPYDARLGLLSEIAAAVDYAHEQGVIHRDLKPSNIFVDRRGHVKLLDFGIAAWQQRPAAETEIAPTIALSPAYASPEQARGEHTTRATDIYSFGMVAYELLTGLLPLPLKGLPLPDVLNAIALGRVVAPSEALRNADSAVLAEIGAKRQLSPEHLIDRLGRTADRIVLHSLAKRSEDRPKSAREVVDRLTAGAARSRAAEIWHRLAGWIPALLGVTALIVAMSTGHVYLTYPAALLGLTALGWLSLHRASLLNWLTVFLPMLVAPYAALLLVEIQPGFQLDAPTNTVKIIIPTDPSPVTIVGLLLPLLFGLQWLRASRLGPLLASGWSAPGPSAVLVCVALAVELPFREPGVLSAAGRLACLAAAVLSLSFQIRRDGIVARGKIYRWRGLSSFRCTGSEVVLRLNGSRILRVRMSNGFIDRARQILPGRLLGERV